MNLTLAVGAAGLLLAIGAFFYRAHLDSGDVEKAQAEIAAQAAHMVEVKQAVIDQDSLDLQAAEDNAQKSIDAEQKQWRARYDAAIASSRAALSKLPACPIPVADLGLLGAPAQGGSANKVPDHSSPGPGDANGGTVDAACVILSCESDQAAFQRVSARLANCVARYNDVRAKYNAVSKP